MADVVAIAWQATAGSAYPDYRDLHVLQGQKSRRLDTLLRIFLSDGTPLLANETSKFAAANITSVQFVPVFPFTVTTHGAAVDPTTGVVSTGVPAGTAFPRNFIITATVMAKVGGATTPTKFTMPIRMHVHSGVTAVHLTPSTLTARQELKTGVAPSVVSFSIFVVFDDGVIGDVTHNGDPAVPAGLNGPDPAIVDLGPELDVGPDAFVDTAAVMSTLDLTLTTDTAVAHLAGSLGLPVWLLLARPCDWRWGVDGDTTPFYRTARLFRQTAAGNWDSLFAGLDAALAARLLGNQHAA
jgi:hypothetical protein